MEITQQQAIGLLEVYRQELIEAVSATIMGVEDLREKVTVALPFPIDFPCEDHMEDADDLFSHFIEADYNLPGNKFTKILVLGLSVPIPEDLR